MPRRRKAESLDKRRLCAAALALAGREGFAAVTPEGLAHEVGATAEEVRRHFPEPAALVTELVRFIDEETAAAIGVVDHGSPAHDRLFDILMSRFDTLQHYREGVLAVAQACARRPDLGTAILKAQWDSMHKMLDLAGLREDGLRGLAQTTGLMALYNLAFCRWRNDTTPDMSRTMAALDRALKRAGQAADFILRRS